MAALIKKSDWYYYKKYPGYTQERDGKKYLLCANDDGPATFREVEIVTNKTVFQE